MITTNNSKTINITKVQNVIPEQSFAALLIMVINLDALVSMIDLKIIIY
jgi:hypothetical protein